jgi:hypothetical protein
VNVPVSPGIPAILLATAAKLGYRVTLGARGSAPELGVFVNADTGADQPLLLVDDPDDDKPVVLWALVGAPSCIPFVFDRLTYNVLHEGVHADGIDLLEWQGRSYSIGATWDGFRPVAQAALV